MRHAFLADIHANLEAFQAVLADLDTQTIDDTFCVGDIVGYGADPSKCLALIREIALRTVAGNHDYAAAGKIPYDLFNEYARAAILWTRDQLTEEERTWLGELPLVVHEEAFTLTHSSLDRPEKFDYIETLAEASACLQMMEKPLCFVAHSHVPIVFFQCAEGAEPAYERDIDKPIRVKGKMIVNVGSVGQPRDEDPRAAYCIYDTDSQAITIRRVNYDIATAANKVRAAGLPELLAFRLGIGR